MATIDIANPGTDEQIWIEDGGSPSVRFFAKRFSPPADQPTRAAVLLVHGYIEHCSRFDHVGKYYASKGIEFFGFDQRGFGRTAKDGPNPRRDYTNTSWLEQFKDIEFMLKNYRSWLDDKYGKDKVPIYLVGHSMGGGLALGFMTRNGSAFNYPAPQTLDLIHGVIATGPWLRLIDQPPSILPMIAKPAFTLLPFLRHRAPLKPEEISRDKAVQEDNRQDKYCDTDVLLKSIHGPLTGGISILTKDYKAWPESKPVLVTHGEADLITNPKGSKEFIEKVKATDKEYKGWPEYYHECHNEPGNDKVVFLDYCIDWILKRTPQSGASPTSGSSNVTEPAAVIAADASAQIDEVKSNGKISENGNGAAMGVASGLDPSAAKSNGKASKRRACWATLLTRDNYVPGLVVLSQTLLRDHGSKYPLVVMVTSTLSERAREVIEQLGCEVREVSPVLPGQKSTSQAFERFTEAWTKLRAFELDEFERVVMIDSDMLIRRNMDELIDELPLGSHQIAAGFACTCNPNKIATYPDDWIPANCAFTPQRHPECLTKPTALTKDSPPTYKLLNSGLVVITPSQTTMSQMIDQIQTDPKVAAYRFPDQDFLADWFEGEGYVPLPWIYNALKPTRECHPEMWRDEEVRNIHYILNKPWTSGYPLPDSKVQFADVHRWWWDVYRRIEPTRAGITSESLWNELIVPNIKDEPQLE
ncbi:hypothetical protein CF319_g2401 [Tilletia indica]|nr:hypothetical protein CF319_g2401 [Tilletia indica]